MNKLTTIERAYEIARGGACANVEVIIKQLKTEGRFDARVQLSGPRLRRDLDRLCYALRADLVVFGASLPPAAVS